MKLPLTLKTKKREAYQIHPDDLDYYRNYRNNLSEFIDQNFREFKMLDYIKLNHELNRLNAAIKTSESIFLQNLV